MKGHRCKHQVAALMAAEEKQNNTDTQAVMDGAQVDFKDLISDQIKQAIIQANSAIDPFEIIGQRTFSQESYDHALRLIDTLQEINFRKVDDKIACLRIYLEF